MKQSSVREKCYIDGVVCSGARFSFCSECKKAQNEKRYKEKTRRANSPVKLSLAHIPEMEDEKSENIDEIRIIRGEVKGEKE